MTIRLLIVDDHEVVRQGLRAFLQLQPDMAIVGEAGDGAVAVRRASELHPDVVLLDLVMPGGDGVTAITAIREAAPGARILVLTSFARDADLSAAIQAGAAGYQLKDIDPETLATAIRDVSQGRPSLHPTVASQLMRHAAEPPGAELTAREREVLSLLTEGLANKQIAMRLEISEKTVKTHVSSVIAKLGVADRTQAAVLALRRRLRER